MIFSSPVQYAIRAMTYLGEQEVGKVCSTREISSAMNIPMPYLAKIVNRLSRRRLIIARRGPAGGVMLAKPASRITVAEIIDAMGGTVVNKECILGIAECGESTPCPVHDSWKTVRELLRQKLHEQTVRDLARARSSKLVPRN
jgi:Rrf2 family protein